MQLVIFGSVASGSVTLNADGHRCKLSRQDDGTWKASKPSALEEIQRIASESLIELVPTLFPGHVPANSAVKVKP